MYPYRCCCCIDWVTKQLLVRGNRVPSKAVQQYRVPPTLAAVAVQPKNCRRKDGLQCELRRTLMLAFTCIRRSLIFATAMRLPSLPISVSSTNRPEPIDAGHKETISSTRLTLPAALDRSPPLPPIPLPALGLPGGLGRDAIISFPVDNGALCLEPYSPKTSGVDPPVLL